MINNFKNSRGEKFSENENPKQAPIGFKSYWIYLFFMFFMLLLFFMNLQFKTNEISWLKFENTMLSQHDVEKIVVINKETAEIYIKQERLEDEKYKDISVRVITGKRSK